MMKNDPTLNSQASSEADVIREATRVAPLPTPKTLLKTEEIKLPTIRLVNR